jgi:hypothetical protein
LRNLGVLVRRAFCRMAAAVAFAGAGGAHSPFAGFAALPDPDVVGAGRRSGTTETVRPPGACGAPRLLRVAQPKLGAMPGRRVHKCSYCRQAYTTADYLNLHMRFRHRELIASLPWLGLTDARGSGATGTALPAVDAPPALAPPPRRAPRRPLANGEQVEHVPVWAAGTTVVMPLMGGGSGVGVRSGLRVAAKARDVRPWHVPRVGPALLGSVTTCARTLPVPPRRSRSMSVGCVAENAANAALLPAAAPRAPQAPQAPQGTLDVVLSDGLSKRLPGDLSRRLYHDQSEDRPGGQSKDQPEDQSRPAPDVHASAGDVVQCREHACAEGSRPPTEPPPPLLAPTEEWLTWLAL